MRLGRTAAVAGNVGLGRDMDQYVLRTRADGPDLRKAAMAIEQAAWNALGFLNFTRAHFQFYQDLLDRYADYQMCLIDEETGYPVAVGNCVPIHGDINDLPEEGWDWVVESAANPRGPANLLGALAISVPTVHRSKGLARRMIKEFRALAERRGLDGVVAPVRPSSKNKHPFVAIQDYISWRDDRGRAYDPWLRSHLAEGGVIVRPCVKSMVVEEPLPFWETWTGQRFDQSGLFAIDGALMPLEVDLRRGIGRYQEPNVWFAYAIA